jgi:hypothetical protein
MSWGKNLMIFWWCPCAHARTKFTEFAAGPHKQGRMITDASVGLRIDAAYRISVRAARQ